MTAVFLITGIALNVEGTPTRDMVDFMEVETVPLVGDTINLYKNGESRGTYKVVRRHLVYDSIKELGHPREIWHLTVETI